MLELTDGIDNTGGVKWQLAMTLLAAWVLVYFCMWKGVKSSGKVCHYLLKGATQSDSKDVDPEKNSQKYWKHSETNTLITEAFRLTLNRVIL